MNATVRGWEHVKACTKVSQCGLGVSPSRGATAVLGSPQVEQVASTGEPGGWAGLVGLRPRILVLYDLPTLLSTLVALLGETP